MSKYRKECWTDADVRCPFYISDERSARSITCEGCMEETKATMSFIPLCEMLGCYADESERIASYNDGKKHIVFPNGSRILFRYCDNDKDALRFQGTEVDVLFVDEATQQSEEKMEKLRACVRGVNDFPKRVYYTCNPGGEGHAWVKRLFIDRRFKEGEEPEEHSFIQSLIYLALQHTRADGGGGGDGCIHPVRFLRRMGAQGQDKAQGDEHGDSAHKAAALRPHEDQARGQGDVPAVLRGKDNIFRE